MSTPVFAQVSYDVEGASKACGLAMSTVREAISKGDLPVRYYGKKPLVLANDLYEWINDLPDEKKR